MTPKCSRDNIALIAKDYFGKKPLVIKNLSRSNLNHIFKLDYPKRSYYLKSYDEDWKAVKEAYLTNLISKKTQVKVPKVICENHKKDIIPQSYVIMSALMGSNLDMAYKAKKSSSILQAAGAALARIHSIPMDGFGWIVGKKIEPRFKSLTDFYNHDFLHKIESVSSQASLRPLVGSLNRFFKEYVSLLDTKSKAVLVHKDFHCSHILVKNDKVSGIIDFEWSIAGHREHDFTKILLWDFPKWKNAEISFFKGYEKIHPICDEYELRKPFYEMMHHLSNLNMSIKLKRKGYMKINAERLRRFFQNENFA